MPKDLLEKLQNLPSISQLGTGAERYPSFSVGFGRYFNETIWQFDEIVRMVEETRARISSKVSNSAALVPEVIQAFSHDHTGFERPLSTTIGAQELWTIYNTMIEYTFADTSNRRLANEGTKLWPGFHYCEDICDSVVCMW